MRELANALSGYGNELMVLCADIPRLYREESPPNMRFRAIELFPGYVPLIFGMSRIKHLDADVYHSHCPPPFFSRAINRYGKHPHVVTYHFDLAVPERVRGMRIPRAVAKHVERIYNRHYATQLLDDSDAIIVTGRSYAETSPVLGDYLHKCTVIPNGIDLRKFDSVIKQLVRVTERRKNILFVGRLVYPKGIEYLIRALPGVLRDVPDAKLVIVGDGEDRDRLRMLVERLNLSSKVEFRGFLSFKDLVRSYLEASVFVLPSFTRLENFGIVLLEAMACRTPVIASDIPGVRENITNGNGLLFPTCDVASLSDAIVRVLSDEEQIMRMGAAGRKLVESNYDWRMIAARVLQLYESLM